MRKTEKTRNSMPCSVTHDNDDLCQIYGVFVNVESDKTEERKISETLKSDKTLVNNQRFVRILTCSVHAIILYSKSVVKRAESQTESPI